LKGFIKKMKYKIAITPSSFAQTSKKPMELLSNKFKQISLNTYGRRLSKAETLEILNECDGVIAGLEKYDEEVFSQCPKLKVISRVGIGIDNIDLNAAKKHNIKVLNTPDEPAFAVAEMTFSVLMNCIKNISYFNNNTHKKIWQKKINKSLKDMNIFLIGYGRIGNEFHKLLKPFSPNVTFFDPAFEDDKSFLELKDGIKNADVISIHANTKKVILDKDTFKYMNTGVIILNPSRDINVDKDELLKYVDKKIISYAWFDAFENEPYDGKLVGKKNIILTPHISTYTDVCRRTMEVKAAENLLEILSGN
tara:strand:+ start:8357 stop:9280 length:924 start_codon:yes stop_codon:yes gene_type:complete